MSQQMTPDTLAQGVSNVRSTPVAEQRAFELIATELDVL